jgi:hypothetical protein
MHPDIAETESLAVFVFDSEDLKQDGAHWKAFMPTKADGERSVYRVDGLDFPGIAAIGQAIAATRTNQQLRGWATFPASVMAKLPGLRLRPDVLPNRPANEMPERHAVIDSWPAEKNDKRACALVLSDAAETVRFPL